MDISKYFLLNDGAPIKKKFEKILRHSQFTVNEEGKKYLMKVSINNQDSDDSLGSDESSYIESES